MKMANKQEMRKNLFSCSTYLSCGFMTPNANFFSKDNVSCAHPCTSRTPSFCKRTQQNDCYDEQNSFSIQCKWTLAIRTWGQEFYFIIRISRLVAMISSIQGACRGNMTYFTRIYFIGAHWDRYWNTFAPVWKFSISTVVFYIIFSNCVHQSNLKYNSFLK